MTATILMFDEHRRRAMPRAEVLAARLKDTVTQTIMADYGHLPVVTVACAIRAASRAIDHGGNMMDAMEAGEDEIQARCPGAAAATAGCVSLWQQRKLKHLPAFLDLVAQQVRARLAGRPNMEYHQAMLRARRILEGGGTIGAAVYHALGGVCEGVS